MLYGVGRALRTKQGTSKEVKLCMEKRRQLEGGDSPPAGMRGLCLCCWRQRDSWPSITYSQWPLSSSLSGAVALGASISILMALGSNRGLHWCLHRPHSRYPQLHPAQCSPTLAGLSLASPIPNPLCGLQTAAEPRGLQSPSPALGNRQTNSPGPPAQ